MRRPLVRAHEHPLRDNTCNREDRLRLERRLALPLLLEQLHRRLGAIVDWHNRLALLAAARQQRVVVLQQRLPVRGKAVVEKIPCNTCLKSPLANANEFS